MEAHTKVDIPQAFVATSDDIEKLWRALEAGGMSVKASANCADGLVRHFATCTSITQYENSKRAALLALEISGQSREPYKTGEISLGARYAAPVSIALRGDEESVSLIRIKLTDIVDGMRPWYSWISTIDLFNVWFPILAFLLLLFQMMTPSNTPLPAYPLQKALLGLVILTAFFGTIALVIWGIARLRSHFFPISSYAFGQGLARHQHHEQIRWIVVVGFLVGLAASVLGTVLLAA